MRRIVKWESINGADSDTLAIGQSASGSAREAVAKGHRNRNAVRQVTLVTIVATDALAGDVRLCGM